MRLRDLAVIAGVPQPDSALVSSLERNGPFSTATLQGNQATDPDALLALRVNGVDLSLDHGYPAQDHRSGSARGAQHQMGAVHRVQGGVR